MTVFIICCVAIFLIIAVVLTTLYVISYRQRQKKKHNFGIKKVKSSVCIIYKQCLLNTYAIILFDNKINQSLDLGPKSE